MADLDVSELLSDPDFMDFFTVTSTMRVVNEQGEPVDTTSQSGLQFGVVIPGKASVRRLDDGSRVESFIDIFSQFQLTAGSKSDDVHSVLPDIVLWRNRQYICMRVEDWSRYGAGYWHASLDLLLLNPPASA